MKRFYPLIFSMSMVALQGQIISSPKWEDVFSYHNVLQIREDNGRLLAATENGIFKYDTQTGEVAKYLSKANGLHNVNITAFDYNSETQTGLVGYADGSLDIITKEGVTYIIDAPINTVYTGSKKINHISIHGNQAVISADYGVSIFRLEKKEYGETFYSGTASNPKPAKESAIYNNTLYTLIGSEIKAFNMQNMHLFNIGTHWSTFRSGNFSNIIANEQVLAFAEGNSLTINNNTTSVDGVVKDININEDKIIVTTDNSVFIYNINGSLITSQTSNKPLNTGWIKNDNIIAGSKEHGLFDFKGFYVPSGPYANRATRLTLHNDKIWVATGGLDGAFNDVAQYPSLGFYFYNGSEWIYPSFFRNNTTYFNILDVAGNPLDYRKTFFANYTRTTGQGFYKLEYDEKNKDFNLSAQYYNENNWQTTSLLHNRPSGLAFDEKGNLYATSGFSFKDRKGYINYAIYSPTTDSFTYRVIEEENVGAIGRPIIRENKLYLPLPRVPKFAIVDLKDSPTHLNDDEIHILTEDNGLIAGYGGNAISASLDNDNQLWIGERYGLRVTNSISNEVSNIKAEPIIIEEKGIGEELFRDQMIVQIETDASNYKWVSVDEGGVFYLSPNGQQTIYHFTKENSPLPNNSVRDIKIDKRTGKVYFATLEGIVTFQSDVKNTSSNFGDVLVYPNPVIYSQHKGSVRIKGLAEKTIIRITDTAGNVVHQAEAKGGWYDWDLAHRGKRVASGIYFVLMTNADGSDNATAKIAVVN